MKEQTENKGLATQSCCSKTGISLGTIIGIALGAGIGILFDKTLNGMIIGFCLGMGLGGLFDARRNK